MMAAVRNWAYRGRKKSIHVYMHLYPSPKIGGGEKRVALMRAGVVRITVLIGFEAIKRLRPRFDTLVLKLG
jgi:hypothetical protein